MPTYTMASHHKLIIDALERVEQGELKRLIVEAPPRHGKSQLSSRHFPAYILGRNPDREVILAAHTNDLARTFNRDIQRIMASPLYENVFPEAKIGTGGRMRDGDMSIRNADEFTILGYNGRLRSIGVGGAIVGRGFDIGIIDDPVANVESADSPAIREMTWAWFLAEFSTRQQTEDAAIVIVTTRWSLDDLVGRQRRLLEDNSYRGEPWEILTYPAISDDRPRSRGDTRAINEPLWPGRFSLNALEAKRDDFIKSGQARLWFAEYQQQPLEEAERIWMPDRVRRYTADGPWVKREDGKSIEWRALTRYMTCDPATSKRDTGAKVKRSSFTAMAMWGVDNEGNAYLLDAKRERLGPTEIMPGIKKFARRWSCTTIGVESIAFQALILELGRLTHAEAYYFELKADKSKEDRLKAGVAHCLGEGKCWFPTEAVWLAELERELIEFPRGSSNDMVDVIAYGLTESVKRVGSTVVVNVEDVKWGRGRRSRYRM